jgi:hypothetical protein
LAKPEEGIVDRQIRQLEFEEYERLSTDFRKAMREALQAKKRYEVVEDGIEDKLTKPKGRTIVSEETIQDIRAAYGAEQTEILHRYGDNKDEIEAKGSDDIQHRDRMTAGQVQSIVREQQQAELAECAQVARTQLQVAHEQYEKRIAKRAEAVREQLFGGIEDAAALARAATADEPELKECWP